MEPLNPEATVLCKLGSLAVHVEEMLSPDGHAADQDAINGILVDPEVRQWLDEMNKLGLLPVKRSTPSSGS